MTFLRYRSLILHNYSLGGFTLNRPIYLTPFLNLTLALLSIKLSNFWVSTIATQKLLKLLKSVNCFRAFYMALVRSILEFWVIVWHYYLAKYQLRIQCVQNQFLTHSAVSNVCSIFVLHKFTFVKNTVRCQQVRYDVLGYK